MASHASGFIGKDLFAALVIGVGLVSALPHADLAVDAPVLVPLHDEVVIVLAGLAIKHVSSFRRKARSVSRS
jgi:hypothetical protein